METTTNNTAQKSKKYAFPKKPSHYFHADEDFREDWDWGKEKSNQYPTRSTAISQAANLVAR